MIAGLSLLALLSSGCYGTVDGGRVTGTRASSAPTALRDCGADAYFGGPDGGVVAGLDWPSGTWPLGTSVQAYLCLGTFRGSVVDVLQSGSPLIVQPTRFPGPELSAVLPVTITATVAGTTTLRLRVTTDAGKPEVLRTVALVVADNERWHFEHAD